ncbi:TPA: replication factor C small subunit [Candidatus Micrarchaeota archaeon]|nr:replication factor C small subunit [Candidatus Micrarchaeota archaeon]
MSLHSHSGGNEAGASASENSASDFVPWVEKYRPLKLADVIGHAAISNRLEAYVKSKNVPHMIFSGPAGTGKTTSSLALARELYGDEFRQSFLELNASDDRGIDVVRGKVKDFARTLPLTDVPFKIIFLDEADAMTQDAQQALRRTMERFSANTRFILSCNYSSRLIEPIQSRCAVFRFSSLSEEDVRRVVALVAKGEGLKLEKAAEDAVVYVAEGDARKAINCLQGASVSGGRISEEDVFKISSRARPAEVGKMIEFAYGGRFWEARKLLDDLLVRYGMSGEDVIKQMFREITCLDIPDKKKVLLVDRVGEYDFRMVEGADDRIQLEALLAQIMLLGSEQ